MREKLVNSISIFLAFVLGGLASYFYIEYKLPNAYSVGGGEVVCKKTCTNTVVQTENSISGAVEKVFDAVMMVQNYKNDQIQSTGTAFVYKTDDKYGYLLTNQHVVQGNTKVVLINSLDKEVQATVLGGDEYLDLAVLRINKNEVLKVVEIGSSDSTKLGDTVFTIGSPLGYEYRGTVTRGTLSGKDRLVNVTISSTNEEYMMKVLQTDAAINPGNSGGPLLNSEGKVIGINSMKLIQSSVEGMGFAIPIEYAMAHVDVLESGKPIERPLLGINLVNVSDTAYLYRNGILIDNSIKEGVVVVNVVSGSAADKAGLKKGDVITKIGSEKITDAAMLKYVLYKYSVGDTIKVTYIRGKDTKTTDAKLTKNT